MKRALLYCLFVCGTVLGAQAQTVSTFADLQRGAFGDGLTMSADGDLFASQGYDGSVVLRIDQEGIVQEFASGLQGSVGAYFDPDGFLYVNSYTGGLLYRIDREGTVDRFASNLNGPAGIVVGPAGKVYVSEFGADFSGSGSRVREVSSDGTASSYATGSGLRDVIGIARDDSGNLYASNWQGGQVYKITPQHDISLFADIPGSINQIAFANGHLYVPSPSLNKVFSIDLAGNVTLIAGTGAAGNLDGPALIATFNRPNSVAVNAAGDTLYILDAATGVIRSISLQASTIAAQQFADSGRNLAAPPELAFLDRFVGEWDVHPIGTSTDAPPVGRMSGRFTLDGTMMQADYRGLNPAGNVTMHGTSLRTWDPVAGHYTMKWAMSFDKGFTIIEARVEDGEFVSTGWGEDRGGAFKERYRFYDFTADSYKFEMDRSYDDGLSWQRWADNQYTRRANQ